MNLFIAGVGTVNLFKGTELALSSKTLVDSSIGFTVTLEDIRAGEGAKLYGKYAHTTGMTMKLTDAMWRMDFLAANIGADVVPNAGTSLTTVAKTVAAGGKLDITDIAPKPLYDAVPEVYVWVTVEGKEEYTKYLITEGMTELTTDLDEGTKVCVKFIKDNASDKTLVVRGDFIPDTLTAILEANIFAGGANDAGSSTKVGKLSILIPRFMLNGTMDFSMTMTGAAQTAIEGSALAVESVDCENGSSYYAIISEVLFDTNWYDELEGVFVEGSEIEVEIPLGGNINVPLTVFGAFKGNTMKRLNPDQYTITKVGDAAGFSVVSNEILVASTATADTECEFQVVDNGEGKYEDTIIIRAIQG